MIANWKDNVQQKRLQENHNSSLRESNQLRNGRSSGSNATKIHPRPENQTRKLPKAMSTHKNQSFTRCNIHQYPLLAVTAFVLFQRSKVCDKYFTVRSSSNGDVSTLLLPPGSPHSIFSLLAHCTTGGLICAVL